MMGRAVARRYARALFSIANETNSLADTRRELSELAGLLDDNEELRMALFRPLFPVAQRRSVLAAVADKLGSSHLLKNFFLFLIDQRRLIDFDAIRAEFERLADEAAGRTQARVVSASPLSDAQRERLRATLAARTRGDVELEESVDPSLLGGAIATVGDTVFDGSLRTQLSQLRSSLTNGQTKGH